MSAWGRLTATGRWLCASGVPPAWWCNVWTPMERVEGIGLLLMHGRHTHRWNTPTRGGGECVDSPVLKLSPLYSRVLDNVELGWDQGCLVSLHRARVDTCTYIRTQPTYTAHTHTRTHTHTHTHTHSCSSVLAPSPPPSPRSTHNLQGCRTHPLAA